MFFRPNLKISTTKSTEICIRILVGSPSIFEVQSTNKVAQTTTTKKLQIMLSTNHFNAQQGSNISITNYIGQHVPGARRVANEKIPFQTFKKKFKKHDVICGNGQLGTQIYFLLKGKVEVSLERNGTVSILDFVFENEWFADFNSLICQTPSEVRITALTDCTVECIDYRDLQEGAQTSLLVNQVIRHLMERVYLTKADREKQLLTRSARERYEHLIDRQPEVGMFISIKKIAYYLGIQPESLSRIRREIAKERRCKSMEMNASSGDQLPKAV